MSLTAVTTPSSSLEHVATEKKANESVNYLNRSWEYFQPNNESYYKTMGTVWQVAAVASLVAFAALAVTSVALTGIFSPLGIPAVGLGVAVLLGPVVGGYHKLMKRSEEAYEHAERAKEIRAIFDSLPSDRAGLAAKLQQLGISLHQIEDRGIRASLLPLRPVLAHCIYWTNYSQKLLDQSRKDAVDAEEHIRKFPQEIDIRDQKRQSSLNNEELSLIAKTTAAFYLGIVKRPNFSKQFEEVVSYTESSVEKRALAARFNDPAADEFFVISGRRGKEPVSFAQAKSQTVLELSNRIFA